MTTKAPIRVALITGASSGIGAATARLMARRGYRLALLARRADRLESLATELGLGQGAQIIDADLTDTRATGAIVPQIITRFGRLDVLVNNAGYGLQCRYEEMNADELARMMRVNVTAPMLLAAAAVPVMREQGWGRIINIASVGGVTAHPLNVAYCASKHALVGFSKSLRLELAGTGIGVTVVCPGATRTEFFDVAQRDIPFADMIRRFQAPPETVARSVLRAIHRPRAVMFPTWSAWGLARLDRWLPWLIDWSNIRYRDQVLASDPAATAGPDAPHRLGDSGRT